MPIEPVKESSLQSWYCLRTPPKREHIAAKSLALLKGVDSFCPRLRYKKVTRRGKVWWIEAMFPGYIFAKFDRKVSEREVVHTQGVMKLLKFGDHIPVISQEFINEIIELVSSDSQEEDCLTVEPNIDIGDEVELADGALSGIEGKVVEIIPGTERIKILIEFLGGDQVLETDLFSLIISNKQKSREQ